MKNFTYYQPTTVQQAVGLLDGDRYGTSELLAGGTDLLDLQKEYIANPDRVISLTAIADLQTIEVRDDVVRIGAGVKLADLAAHSVLRSEFTALTMTADEVGSPQIRNMATLGGNLCQRTRCWYFRDEHVKCLLKGGDKCFAVGPEAQNRYHAIFTAGHKCVHVHPSTLAPVLISMEAVATVVGPRGEQTIPLANFFQAPTAPDQREHVLAPGEMVTQVIIPRRQLQTASYEVRQKVHHDWPLVQAAVALEMSGSRARKASVVLGHVGPTPEVSEAASRAIEGQAVTEQTAAEVGRIAVANAKPLSQNGYKVRLAEVAVKRALLMAAGSPRYWEG